MMRPLYWCYYLLRDVRQGLLRHAAASLATLLLLTIAVSGLTTAALLEDASQGLARQLEAQSKMRVFLDDSADLASLAAQAEGLAGVERVTPETDQQTRERFRAGFPGGATFLDYLDTIPFPDALLIDLSPGADPRETAAQLQDLPGVSQVIWPQEYLPKLLDVSQSLRRVGGVVVSGLFGLAFLVTLLAVQLNVMNRRDEIAVRLLVGASPVAVRLQFGVEAALLGAAGGLLGAWSAQWVLASLLASFQRTLPALADLNMTVTGAPMPAAAAGALTGAFLAFAAGVLAAWRPSQQWRAW